MLLLQTALLPSPHLLPVALSSEMEPTLSHTRQLLVNRTRHCHKAPLPSTTLATRVAIATLAMTMNLFKTSVDLAQGLASGRKGTAPSISKTIVTKVMIPRLKSIVMDGDVILDNLDIDMSCEFLSRSDSTMERIVIYAHGGAYVLSSRRTHRGITSRIAKYGKAKVLSIDYRLAPMHVFPGPLMDVLSAYRYLLNSGYQAAQISFSGDSAGGSLATAAMLYCRDSNGEFPIPGCVALMSPYDDLTQCLPAWRLNEEYDYLPAALEDDKYFTETRSNLAVSHDLHLCHQYASPVFAKSSKIRICPCLIQLGDAERVRDDGIYFATEAMDHEEEPIRVELFEDAVHVFQLFSMCDAFAEHALERLGEFIRLNSGLQFKQNIVKGALKVYNKSGYPTEDIVDLKSILNDGVALLVEKKIWNIDEAQNVTVTKKLI